MFRRVAKGVVMLPNPNTIKKTKQEMLQGSLTEVKLYATVFDRFVERSQHFNATICCRMFSEMSRSFKQGFIV